MDRNYWLAILERYGEKSSGNRWIVKRRATHLLFAEVIPLIDSRISNYNLDALACTSWFFRRHLFELARLRLKSFSPWYCWLKVRSFYFEVWEDKKRIFMSRLSDLPLPFKIGRSFGLNVQTKARTISRLHLIVENIEQNTCVVNVIGKYGARIERKNIKAKRCWLAPDTRLHFLNCCIRVVEHYE